jgi:hypothetical protein
MHAIRKCQNKILVDWERSNIDNKNLGTSKQETTDGIGGLCCDSESPSKMEFHNSRDRLSEPTSHFSFPFLTDNWRGYAINIMETNI